MFERSCREYPTALAAGPEHGDQGLRDAAIWLLTKAKELGGTPYVFAPGLSNIDGNPLLKALTATRGVASGTYRSRGTWSGGPVLAAWPTRDKLGEIADDRRTTALVVVPWVEGEVDAWVASANPARLGAASTAQHQTLVLDPVVIEGLKHLTVVVNHANNLAGSMDKRDAIAVLRMLKRARYSLPPDAVYSWAMSNGWPARGAERLRELAEKFENGIAVRGGQNAALRPDALSMWRKQAQGSKR